MQASQDSRDKNVECKNHEDDAEALVKDTPATSAADQQTNSNGSKKDQNKCKASPTSNTCPEACCQGEGHQVLHHAGAQAGEVTDLQSEFVANSSPSSSSHGTGALRGPYQETVEGGRPSLLVMGRAALFNRTSGDRRQQRVLRRRVCMRSTSRRLSGSSELH